MPLAPSLSIWRSRRFLLASLSLTPSVACDQQTHINNNTTPGCNYQTCVYANMYILNEDGAPQSAVCSLYSQNWDPIATNTSYNAGWHHYDVTSSIGT